jgi:predicted membrane protein
MKILLLFSQNFAFYVINLIIFFFAISYEARVIYNCLHALHQNQKGKEKEKENNQKKGEHFATAIN